MSATSATSVSSPSPSSITAETQSNILAWKHLPVDVRLCVMSHLSLTDAHQLTLAHPKSEHRAHFRRRVRELFRLRNLWVTSSEPSVPTYSNPIHLRSPNARFALSPTEFSELVRLPLGGTQMQIIPSSISELRNLRMLDASHCALQLLPESLAQCVKLRCLSLGANELVEFPEVVLKLPALIRLHLQWNPITSLPKLGWHGMKSLVRISLYGCELQGELPSELCQFLETPVPTGQVRSANFECNKYDGSEAERVFGQFPKLKRNISM